MAPLSAIQDGKEFNVTIKNVLIPIAQVTGSVSMAAAFVKKTSQGKIAKQNPVWEIAVGMEFAKMETVYVKWVLKEKSVMKDGSYTEK